MRGTYPSAVLLLVSIFVNPCLSSAEPDPRIELIREHVERIWVEGGLEIGDAKVASVVLLPRFYEQRAFSPAWTDPKAVDQLLQAIRKAEQDGLDPADYHLAELERLQAVGAGEHSPAPQADADMDVLLTDALVRLAYHALFGKVDPESLNPDWNLSVEIHDSDPVSVMQEAIDSGELERRIEQLKPAQPQYQRLRSALARYRAIQTAGGWDAVPEGPTLKKGMKDARVVTLRERLQASGDLVGTAADATTFDEQVEEAVMRFQMRHRIDPDGAVGAKTLAALNVPVEARIDQIRVNLERARWIFHHLPDTFLIADIAGFEAFYVEDGEVVWRARAQVGKPYRKTPVFVSEIKYLVFNPTWTIPPGILRKDILPKLKKDPDYLTKRNIRVIDRRGKTIDPHAVDWSRYSGGKLPPYTFRQDPGPDNALGRIKFIFPNDHLVYLHDTPSKSLFDRDERTFSSGCIRVDKPFELAARLLDGRGEWNEGKVMEVVDSQETRTVFLPEPVPVGLLYWTVSTDEDGTVHFKHDPYGRDAAVLKALAGEFTFRKRPVVNID